MAEQISSLDKPITLADWHEIYQRLLPYLGGNKAVDGNPIGTVIMFPISTPPAGYLVCDGSKLSVTAFPLLFDVLKNAPASQRADWGDADWVTEFNVPDYRGEFPRFYGTNSHANQGNGGAVGEHQDGTEHTAGWFNNTEGGWDFTEGASSSYLNLYKKADKRINSSRASSAYTSSLKRQANTSGSGVWFTSRPTNTSFLPCIKYTYVTQEVEYSEQERVVGKWINEKPLYEKTIDCGTLSNNSTKSVPHLVSNLETIIKFEGFTKNSTGTCAPLPQPSDNDASSAIKVWGTATNVVIANRGSDQTSLSAFVTILYTKTTD